MTLMPYTEELEQFENECEDLFSHFQHRNLDALVCAVRSTLDILRRRLSTSSSVRSQNEDGSRPAACFAAELVLSLPNIVSGCIIIPSQPKTMTIFCRF